jgi:1,4-dihydroxy-2-naphthoate octaprenyltransferase
MGKERGVRVYAALFAMAYAMFPVLALLYRNPVWLLGLVSIPVAVRSVRVAKREFDYTPRLIQANAGTVQVYQITGIIMVIAALSNRFISI